ncbi:unnamed protein product [Caenorhabditis sp. 36 PRJEB53466]|nr:unnamed protein product [Caenorhabditis sp. 36 PRJEB53466]
MACQLLRQWTFNQRSDARQEQIARLQKECEKYFREKKRTIIETQIAPIVDDIWKALFNISHETAPKKKYAWAEEFLLQPDALRLLLFAFRCAPNDVKRKIRDLFMLVTTWGSNDGKGSCVPRKSMHSPKVRSQLFHCRHEILLLIAEGHEDLDSIDFFNDIVRVFAEDDVCLSVILDDDGRDPPGFPLYTRAPAIWEVFRRLVVPALNTYHDPFDSTVSAFEMLKIILDTNHALVQEFIARNNARFTQAMQKLIVSANFYIQAKSLKLLHDMFHIRAFDDVRAEWLASDSFLRVVMLAIQHKNRTVRTEAFKLLELFLMNPAVPPSIYKFFAQNSDALVAYCLECAPTNKYDGNVIEQEDERISRIAYKLINWRMQRPMRKEEMAEFENAESYQGRQRIEQTVKSHLTEDRPQVPLVKHQFKFSDRIPAYPQFLREPMIFGAPPQIQKK